MKSQSEASTWSQGLLTESIILWQFYDDMFKLAALATLVLPILATPEKRSSAMSCVQFQYENPFDTQNANGWVDLWTNQTDGTTYEAAQMAINVNGDLAACIECGTPGRFAFQVCEGPGIKGFESEENSVRFSYGHILHRDDSGTIQCLQAASTTLENSTLGLGDCSFDFDGAGTSRQYFHLAMASGPDAPLAPPQARMEQTGGVTIGPLLGGDGLVRLTGSTPGFTYFAFKPAAPQTQ